MIQKKFFDEQHARTYLIGSIIRYKNKPIYIKDLQNTERGGDHLKKYKVIYTPVGEDDNSILFIPNARIDMTPVPLGMMNTNSHTWYVQRNPSRGWKVGLDSSNISYQIISGQALENMGKNKPNHGFNSRYLNKCIMGDYPTYKEALRKISEGDRFSTAFSRKFAVNRGGLVFKSIDDTIGVCERKGPVLFDHFQYLQEVLEEDMEK